MKDSDVTAAAHGASPIGCADVVKARRTHFKSPCIHCGLLMEDFPIGDCTGDPSKAIPIAYASLGVRHDSVEHFRVRFSDNRVEDRWHHISEIAHYHHFGHSSELRHPPRYDERLKLDEPRGLSASEQSSNCEAVDPTPETLQHGRRG